MAGERQKPLPGFEEYLGQPNAPLRFPQPRIDNYRPPSWYDILYHPLDINFKGRLRAWINNSELQEGFYLREVLPEFYVRLITLYLFDDSWPNKSKVMAQIEGDPDSNLKVPLVRALIRVWRRVKNGSRAIELLRISPEDNFLYDSIISHTISGPGEHRKIRTLDELVSCSRDDIRKICQTGAVFNKLKTYLKPYYPGWKPEITFREEE